MEKRQAATLARIEQQKEDAKQKELARAQVEQEKAANKERQVQAMRAARKQKETRAMEREMELRSQRRVEAERSKLNFAMRYSCSTCDLRICQYGRETRDFMFV